ncbi:uncharacterized protein BJ171DRAFT_463948 [Polychytrium aggregatum]|uniref:uncharacterized protein n=1 Tax=Polychytrium aggregatum TaxID=110093 RepID=UPI0022FE8A4D|nr:uncharacterized protein BJ171DRAFT_463948 [Polychytrium aggregatum]KAI9193711.1 hypothetical protein BJ171DRAFT_463948 [Polychytrium aggregatum]
MARKRHLKLPESESEPEDDAVPASLPARVKPEPEASSGGDIVKKEKRRKAASTPAPAEQRAIIQSSRTDRSAKSPYNQDRFLDGSIVRIKLKCFLTYDLVEFFPGPDLNMVIGPNGAGKSTIVCALALGLAGKPEVLGRAKELHEFIKHGHEKAEIEIELRSRRRGNVTITRLFKKIEKGSSGQVSTQTTWKINGSVVTPKVVEETVLSFKIQVDNLCQFLPQDKVCEFAKMNSSQLLQETERAAGDPRLFEWHQQLINLKNEERSFGVTVSQDQANLDALKSKNATIEADVHRFEQREQVLDEVSRVEYLLAHSAMEAAAQVYQSKRSQLSGLETHQQETQNELTATEAEFTAAKDKNDQSRRTDNSKRTEYDRLVSSMQESLEAFGTATADYEASKKNVEGVKRKEQERKKRRKELELSVQRSEAKVHEAREAFLEVGYSPSGDEPPKMQELAREIDEINTELRENFKDVQSIGNEMALIDADSDRIRKAREEMQRKLDDMDSIQNRKIQIIENDDYLVHVRRTIDWLKHNQSKFRSKIFLPIILEVQATQPEYAQIIEAAIGRYSLTFVALNTDDYRKFSGEVNDQHHWRVDSLNAQSVLDRDYSPTVPVEEIRSLGFDGYLIDYIQGPPEIIQALCHLSNIHRMPVSLSANSVDHERVQNHKGIPRYIAGDMTYHTRFAYGQSTTAVSQLRPAKYLIHSVDTNQKAEIKRKMDELIDSLQTNSSKMQQLGAKESKLRKKDETLKNDQKLKWAERRRIESVKSAYEHAKLRLESDETSLEHLNQQRSDQSKKLKDLERRIFEAAKQKAKASLRLQIATKKCNEGSTKLIESSLGMLYAASNFQNVKNRLEEARVACRDATNQLLQAKESLKEFKRAAQEKRDAFRSVAQKRKLTQEELDAVREKYRDMPLESLELKVNELNALAEMVHVDQRVINEFNQRKQEIDRLQAKLDSSTSRQHDMIQGIDDIHNEWFPKLEALITKISQTFSDSFLEIGCVGEVRIRKEEDYSKWGVEILVKFRDTEKLQVLTGFRQSGGERSVSTILYLMALQGLSTSPFRVVDEINQGMDPRNERMIHRQMVNVACRDGASQQFLITPKLLPDLDYHPRMTVLCIYNGEWQEDRFDIHEYIRKARRGR